MAGMRILCCDPEGCSRRGGLSIALRRLIDGLRSPALELWQVEQQTDGWSARCPDQPNQHASTFELLLQRVRPGLLLAVGWHTWSEAAVVAARQKGIPTVFWSHGVGCLTWYSARPLMGFLRWCLRSPRLLSVGTTLQQVDHLVVAYSRSDALDPRSVDETIARHWLAKDVSIIGNPVDTEFWSPAKLRPPQPSSVLSLGRLEWQKGHATALRIAMAAKSRPLHFCCMAPGINTYGKALQRQARRLAGDHRLHLMVGLSPEQRRQQLQQALVLISWSETEYQSLAMLEALACGCPVIARPRGWLRHEPVPGILVANNPREAIDWLDALANDSGLGTRLGAEGRTYVEQHHALAVVTRQWNHVFNQLRKPG
jgi:glycosyltransferase involved in cell wall biosynthesis